MRILHSIIIVSNNRAEELLFTLNEIKKLIDPNLTEILIYLDGCLSLKNQFAFLKSNSILFFGSNDVVGPSIARNKLINCARGMYVYGFDDDSHPLTEAFLEISKKIFEKNKNTGIISFEELRDNEYSETQKYLNMTNEFIGCGFAMQKKIFEETNGFPIWMTYYGEESCLSIEILAKGYDIVSTNHVSVLHRINRFERGPQNFVRFENQLRNMFFYYLIYHPFPILKIVKLIFHNFTKYCLASHDYRRSFFKAIFQVFKDYKSVIQFRQPINLAVWRRKKSLQNPFFK